MNIVVDDTLSLDPGCLELAPFNQSGDIASSGFSKRFLLLYGIRMSDISYMQCPLADPVSSVTFGRLACYMW